MKRKTLILTALLLSSILVIAVLMIIVYKKEPTPNTEKRKEPISKNVPKTKKGYEIKQINGITYIEGILIANKSYELPSDYAPNGLLEEFINAYQQMQEDAKQENIYLNMISGYRSYERQNTLYNNYVASEGQEKADTYSARPGHSEHQSGLAADLNSLNTDFAETKEAKWISENCYKYGFILRYPEGKQEITGYIFEPWHIRYIGKKAKDLYQNGTWITLEEYLGIDSKY